MIARIYKNYFCVDLFGTDKCFFKTQSVIDSVELIPSILAAELNGFPPELIPSIDYWTAKTFDTKEHYLKIYLSFRNDAITTEELYATVEIVIYESGKVHCNFTTRKGNQLKISHLFHKDIRTRKLKLDLLMTMLEVELLMTQSVTVDP